MAQIYNYYLFVVDSEDLELVGMLHDMEDSEKPENDSIMAAVGTEQYTEIDEDDIEYSQVFNDETIPLEPFKRLNIINFEISFLIRQ